MWRASRDPDSALEKMIAEILSDSDSIDSLVESDSDSEVETNNIEASGPRQSSDVICSDWDSKDELPLNIIRG